MMTPKEFVERYEPGQEFEIDTELYGLDQFTYANWNGKWKYIRVENCEYTRHSCGRFCYGMIRMEKIKSGIIANKCLGFTVPGSLKQEIPLAYIPVNLKHRFIKDEDFEI